MADVLEQLVVLCNQLVAIGYEQPNVLIAGMFIVAAIAITIVACVFGLIISVPIMIFMGIGKLIGWAWRRKHPCKPIPFEQDEVNYIPQRRQSSTPKKQSQRPASPPPSDLPPVYPNWMNQKSGRLL